MICNNKFDSIQLQKQFSSHISALKSVIIKPATDYKTTQSFTKNKIY